MRLLAVLAFLLLAGCASHPASAPDLGRASRPGAEADGGEPLTPEETLGQAQASGARIDALPVDQDIQVLPGACPDLGVVCGGPSGEARVDHAGADRWVGNLTFSWTPTSPVMDRFAVSAQPYRDCGFGCIEGGRNVTRATSGSPLPIHAVLGGLERNKGVWIIVETPPNVAFAAVSTGQAVHVAGTLYAIDDP